MSVSRRKFLGQSVLGLTAFSIVPRHVLGKGFLAPSDQLTKAIVGTGGMLIEGTIGVDEVNMVHSPLEIV